MEMHHVWSHQRQYFPSISNVAPQAYDYDPQTRQNLNRMQRSELRYSVVEFVAPTEYMVRPPQPLVYLFVIDVSFTAITSGLVATATRVILENLDRIPNKDGRTKIGFIAVDSSLHYFSVAPGAPDANMLVVGDIDDTFLPQPQDLLLNINECREGIEALLGQFSTLFATNQNGNNAMGSALKAAHKLISPIGGKVVCLMSSLPNISTGKLSPREQAAGANKEAALLQAQNSFYKSFAVECSKHQVSVDMFLFSSSYQDVATLSCLPRYTGGQTFYYPGWSASRSEDTIKFASEFSKFLGMEIALEAVMRIRATSGTPPGKYFDTGLRMASFYGNFFNRSSDLCAFPAFPRDQGYVVEVAIDETITKPFVCLQAAILHSTCFGTGPWVIY
jgi:protein transport protein SEC24